MLTVSQTEREAMLGVRMCPDDVRAIQIDACRELDVLKSKVLQLHDAVQKNHEWHQASEDSDAYADSSLSDLNVAALKIYTTDSAWVNSLHHTLGLLRSARSYIPNSSIVGSITIPLDKEIKRLEKLLSRETK